MKKISLLIIILLISLSLKAHPWKPAHYVIIETDGGIDDMRAISMMLASPDIRVLAIISSPGTLDTENCYLKVKSLLNSFYHEGIPVGINRSVAGNSQNFSVALNTKWGVETGLNPSNAPDHLLLLKEILEIEKTPISFICLGGLSTVSSALETIPVFREQVKEIIWSCDGLTDKSGFNYNIDSIASEKVLSDNLPLRAIKSYAEEMFYSNDIIKEIATTKTVYAKKISTFFENESASAHDYSFRGTDEMASLYLQFPDMFVTDIKGNFTESVPFNKKGLKQSSIVMLAGKTVARNQVIKDIPLYPSFYFNDIEPSVNEIIEKYGENEWVSGVLANELHRHLGVFAIIGVKMGIRAREYFNTGVDEFSVTTFAGSMPPLSCMNDGIQVSTGATVGHGLIAVRTDTLTFPSAEFTYMNRKIRLTLSPEIATKISAELKEINFVYGLDSDVYWELVRKNSIKYWLELDRHDIFKIEVLN